MIYINLLLALGIHPLRFAAVTDNLTGGGNEVAVGAKTWATDKLRAGDLTALAAIATSRGHADEGRILRLQERGFIARQQDRSFRVTPRGRVALLIKRLMLR